MDNKLSELMNKIGYEFKDIDLLIEALTHRSFANENSYSKKINNEKLEFLGDAVLDLITTEYIYDVMDTESEGELAKSKSQIISEPVFSNIASELELGEYLYLSNGETLTGGKSRKSILGDAFEALIGAIFKDSDYYTTRNIALTFLKDKIENLHEIEETKDYKTILQEMFQSKFHKLPTYEIIAEKGPDHSKKFEVAVKLNSKIVGIGSGKSKKEAEKNAAKDTLQHLENSGSSRGEQQ